MTSQAAAPSSTRRIIVIGSVLALIIFCLWAATPTVTRVLLSSAPDDSSMTPGAAGDTFGSVNALFSGLAFLGVILAIYLQNKEIQDSIDGQAEALRAHHEQNRLIRDATAIENTVRCLDGWRKYRPSIERCKHYFENASHPRRRNEPGDDDLVLDITRTADSLNIVAVLLRHERVDRQVLLATLMDNLREWQDIISELHKFRDSGFEEVDLFLARTELFYLVSQEQGVGMDLRDIFKGL